MAINLGLNIRTNSKSSQTVSVVASSGVTLASISSTNKRLTVSATENVAKELCTVTFTAGTNLYYSKEPEFVQNFTDATLSFTSSVTKNSLGRVITKTFVISATASINSIYNILTFSEKISVSSVAGVNNSVLKQIDNINFNTSEVISSGETRLLKVSGKQNTQFSVKLTRSSDSKTYDFDTGTFTTSATTSGTKKITSSGVVDLPIILPSSSVLETYTLETTADEQSVSKLDSSLQDTSGGLVNTLTFKQAISASVTFTCVSANSAYTGTHGSKPSSTAISGQSGSSSDAVNFIELSPKLHTKAFKKGKEIELNDFQFISGTALVLSGTPGGTVSGTLTFTGSGPDMIQQSTGLLFGVSSSDNSKLADFVVNDVSKTANANSTGTTITLANAEDDAVGTVVGVYTEQSTIANSANAGGRLVSSVDSSQNTIVVNANTTIRSGQVITFTNAGRVAEISFALTIIQFPTKNTTVSIALDNLLTIDPNWS
jgi:hypothetical protein